MGLDATETPRDVAFCAHAILQDALLEVPDATADARFQDNPLVTADPNIRFYAGAQLKTPDGQAVGTLCVIDKVSRTLTAAQRDALAAISRQVVAQMELRKNLRSLTVTIANLNEAKMELAHANGELDRKRIEAESANTSKSAFLANMSHELRTPLNAIIGYSEMLAEEAVESKRDDMVPDLDRIRNSGKHLLELINDILDISKIEAGKMEVYCERFELGEALEDICETTRPLIEKNGNVLHREFDCGNKIMCSDRTKIRQCLFNLISNAAKFTEGGEITFGASILNRDGIPTVMFRVRDTGIGMSKQQCAKVFDSFTQADESTTRKFGGTGLGLAITRSFCEMLSGEIGVESTPGEGTTFTMKLPLELPSNRASGSSTALRLKER